MQRIRQMSVLYHRADAGKNAIMTRYVDDILLTGSDKMEVNRMIRSLLETYRGRDLVKPDKLVVINLKATKDGFTLDQACFVEEIVIDGMGFTDMRKVYTPTWPWDGYYTEAMRGKEIGGIVLSICENHWEADTLGGYDLAVYF